MTSPMSEYLTTKELAELLRIKERKVYDLVHQGAIPCSRRAGKWLFPRELVDRWMLDAPVLPQDVRRVLRRRRDARRLRPVHRRRLVRALRLFGRARSRPAFARAFVELGPALAPASGCQPPWCKAERRGSCGTRWKA